MRKKCGEEEKKPGDGRTGEKGTLRGGCRPNAVDGEGADFVIAAVVVVNGLAAVHTRSSRRPHLPAEPLSTAKSDDERADSPSWQFTLE